MKTIDELGCFRTLAWAFLASPGLRDGPARLGALLVELAEDEDHEREGRKCKCASCREHKQQLRRRHVYGQSQTDLAALLGIVPLTVREWLGELEAFGLVKRLKQRSGKPVVYELTPRVVAQGELFLDPDYEPRKQPPRERNQAAIATGSDRGEVGYSDRSNCFGVVPSNCFGDPEAIAAHSTPGSSQTPLPLQTPPQTGAGAGVSLRSPEAPPQTAAETRPEAAQDGSGHANGAGAGGGEADELVALAWRLARHALPFWPEPGEEWLAGKMLLWLGWRNAPAPDAPELALQSFAVERVIREKAQAARFASAYDWRRGGLPAPPPTPRSSAPATPPPELTPEELAKQDEARAALFGKPLPLAPDEVQQPPPSTRPREYSPEAFAALGMEPPIVIESGGAA